MLFNSIRVEFSAAKLARNEVPSLWRHLCIFWNVSSCIRSFRVPWYLDSICSHSSAWSTPEGWIACSSCLGNRFGSPTSFLSLRGFIGVLLARSLLHCWWLSSRVLWVLAGSRVLFLHARVPLLDLSCNLSGLRLVCFSCVIDRRLVAKRGLECLSVIRIAGLKFLGRILSGGLSLWGILSFEQLKTLPGFWEVLVSVFVVYLSELMLCTVHISLIRVSSLSRLVSRSKDICITEFILNRLPLSRRHLIVFVSKSLRECCRVGWCSKSIRAACRVSSWPSSSASHPRVLFVRILSSESFGLMLLTIAWNGLLPCIDGRGVLSFFSKLLCFLDLLSLFLSPIQGGLWILTH